MLQSMRVWPFYPVEAGNPPPKMGRVILSSCQWEPKRANLRAVNNGLVVVFGWFARLTGFPNKCCSVCFACSFAFFPTPLLLSFWLCGGLMECQGRRMGYVREQS
jgi:hypothetical protein